VGDACETVPPVSRVLPLLPVQFFPNFTVRWSGFDLGGSGLKCFDLQYRDGRFGPWHDWLTCTTATQAVFHGLAGHFYYFRSRAVDNAGNVEAWPGWPDAWTFVVRRHGGR
jgi:hypothetical protein